MSRHKMYQALEVASIPDDEFDRLIESKDPPTITELARFGRNAQATPKPTSWDKLRRAWNAASDDDRHRLLREALK